MTKPLIDHAVGDVIRANLLIASTNDGIAGNGQPFRTLYLADKTGQVEARLWNVTDDQKNTLVTGTVIHVFGSITEYNKMKQIRISDIKITTDDPGDYVRSAPVAIDELKATIEAAVDSIDNADIHQVVSRIVNRHRRDLYTFPAAKQLHHAYQHGLAHHISGMLALAETMVDRYPTLNRDLLIAGVILHDIGKVREYDGVIATDITLEGRLLGHIHMMQAELADVCDALDVDKETATLLQHMVLSHHGKPEWGSATKPLIAEAEMLHYIDLIDAKMNMLDTAFSQTKVGTFTPKLFGFDNRTFYRHGLSETEA